MPTLALIGDVMLGRGVNDVLKNMHPNDMWGQPHLMQTDLRVVNLECALTTHNRPWSRNWKMFHFHADPDAGRVLQGPHIDACALANNHILDIEIYRGKPILYDTGDFIDDYAVNPRLHNDRSCLFKVMFEKGKLQRIELIPVILEVTHVALACGEDFKAMSAHIEILCAEFGNRLMHLDNRPFYEISHAVG